MADERYIEIEHNSRQIVGRLRVVEHKAHRRLLDILEESTDDAVAFLKLYSPKWTGYTLRHIDQTKAQWQPGGTGGGGNWVTVAGIKSGTSIHPIYAAMGTGIYVGRGLIVPRSYGKRPDTPDEFRQMFYSGRAGKDFSRRKDRLHYKTRQGAWRTALFVRGQTPKPFLYLTFQSTSLYARARVMTFGRDLF